MTENTVMWPTEARATQIQIILPVPCSVGSAKTAGTGAPGPAFFVPEENDAILYSATAEMDSYTLKTTFVLRE